MFPVLIYYPVSDGLVFTVATDIRDREIEG